MGHDKSIFLVRLLTPEKWLYLGRGDRHGSHASSTRTHTRTTVRRETSVKKRGVRSNVYGRDDRTPLDKFQRDFRSFGRTEECEGFLRPRLTTFKVGYVENPVGEHTVVYILSVVQWHLSTVQTMSERIYMVIYTCKTNDHRTFWTQLINFRCVWIINTKKVYYVNQKH